MDKFKKRLKELSLLFSEAEKQVKKAEEVNRGIVIPSINELRYVGYHIVKALLSEDETILDQELKKAEGHAKRAIYDASEAQIIFYLEKAEEFQKRHIRSDSITDIIPNYVNLLRQLEDIKQQIDLIRKDQDAYRNRAEYYDNCIPNIDELRSINSTLKQATPLIVEKDRKKAKTFILIAMTLFVTVVGLIITIYTNSKEPSAIETQLMDKIINEAQGKVNATL